MDDLKHIAFVPDGNGRWATEKSLSRSAGHRASYINLLSITDYCLKEKITYQQLALLVKLPENKPCFEY